MNPNVTPLWKTLQLVSPLTFERPKKALWPTMHFMSYERVSFTKQYFPWFLPLCIVIFMLFLSCFCHRAFAPMFSSAWNVPNLLSQFISSLSSHLLKGQFILETPPLTISYSPESTWLSSFLIHRNYHNHT